MLLYLQGDAGLVNILATGELAAGHDEPKKWSRLMLVFSLTMFFGVKFLRYSDIHLKY